MARILAPTPENIDTAARLIKSGECVAFPTETVYGLGADAGNTFAVEKIFTLKGRPHDNPLIVHCATKEHIAEYAHITHPIEQMLIDRYMPGPFTIILPKKDSVADAVTAHQPFVGIRIPDHPIAQQFLAACKRAIAAPSANRSGRPSPTSAEMVQANFPNTPLSILDGGPCAVGIESTVVRVVVENDTPRVHILRPGYITDEDIRSIVGPDISVVYPDIDKHLSPGTRYSHYSPNAKVHIIDPTDVAKQLLTLASREKIWLLATQEFFMQYDASISQEVKRYIRGSIDNLVMCAQQLFSLYHQADADGITDLYVEQLPEHGIGYAIMNRVRKSTEK